MNVDVIRSVTTTGLRNIVLVIIIFVIPTTAFQLKANTSLFKFKEHIYRLKFKSLYI